MLMVNACFWNATNTTFHVLINNYIVHRLSLIEREAALSITIFGMLPLSANKLHFLKIKYVAVVFSFKSLMCRVIFLIICITILFFRRSKAGWKCNCCVNQSTEIR